MKHQIPNESSCFQVESRKSFKNTRLIEGTISTLIAAAGFGAVAPVAKVLFSYGMTPVFMLAARFFTASLFLWGYVFVKRKKIYYKLETSQLAVMFLIGGLLYSFTTGFYFNAIKHIPVSLHVMIFYTYPFMVNLFAVLFLKEKITINQVAALFAAFSGILLILSDINKGINLFGVMLSFLAAVCNSTYVLSLGLKKIGNVNSVVTSAYTSTFSAITFIICCFATAQTNFDILPKVWPGIIFISLVSTAVAIIALSAGIKKMGAAKVSIISTFEPIEGVLLSILLLGEQWQFNQLIGGVLVILAIIAINLNEKRI